MANPAVPAPPDMLERALAFAASSMPVFPCLPGGKTPITTHGFRDATTDPDTVRRWWSATPSANIATPTGHPGFDVLDVDVRPDGNGWAGLHRAHASGLLAGWIRAVRTPSGGLHLHYPGTEQRNGSLRGQHLDFRGLGGYVLLPPSIVRTPLGTRPYELTVTRDHPGEPLDWTAVTSLLSPPPASRNDGALQPRSRPSSAGSDPTPWLAAHVARQSEGNRDNALFWAGCRAAEAGATDLSRLVDAAISTGLPERQARRTIRSAQDTIAQGGTHSVPLAHTSTLPPRQPEAPIRSAS
ncbi:MAG TPA: bifunctional DNA primase/polymerase [Dermatophilaceae bacterium]|nr:bifunctional DNA primase/polymerase [Dermatophilaceae bacterium]